MLLLKLSCSYWDLEELEEKQSDRNLDLLMQDLHLIKLKFKKHLLHPS
jgi:hypothetical protein